jgi:hypothetical protein
MDRVDAEAIYDSGRVACVEFILDLVGRFAQHEDRLKRLEEQARRDSRTSSKPPSADPPKSRGAILSVLGMGGVVLAAWSGRKAATTSCS